MLRIFAGLASGNYVVLVAAGILGLVRRDKGVSSEQHVVLGLFALLLSSLIQAALFTYLSVAGKVVSQAVHLGHLDPLPLEKVKRLKRSMVNIVGVVFLAVVVVSASGAASWRGGESSLVHVTGAGALLVVHAVANYRQLAIVFDMSSVVNDALRAYNLRKLSGEGAARDAPVKT